MIVRGASSCSQQGRFILMATTRAAHARSGLGTERLRVQVRRRVASKLRADGDGRRPRIALIEAGFVVLVVSTTWVIASASVWWVPVYLILLIVIFVVPRRRPLVPPAAVTDAVCDAVGIADSEPGLRADCSNGADALRTLSRSDSVLTEGECTEPSTGSPDPGRADATKLRRSRAQGRKSVPGSERASGSVPVVWIQTGPGKFVRVEGGLQAANSAEIAIDSSRTHPASDLPAELIEAVPTQAVLQAEENPPESVGETSIDVEQSCHSDNGVSGSVTEEHGIAPSAFSLTPELRTAFERSEDDLPGQVREAEVRTAVCAEASGDLPPESANSRDDLGQQDYSRRWVSRVSRDLSRAVPRTSRGRRQRLVRLAPGTRILGGSWLAPNVRQPHLASRSSGRMHHFQCDLRTRSPPSC